ncbi:MAG: universal stress protein [Nitrospirae bacterium]|nr:universal stress protein [Nitrospirota bacterium]MDE3041847.1 universal stress protein [Nitrospirota bacterium]
MQRDADLIVLGTHERTGLDHILLGSTAQRVLAVAPCPVLTVREPEGFERRPRGCRSLASISPFAVPIDFSDCSMDALEYGIQIAKDVGASLTLLHVLEPVSYGDDLTLGHAAEQGRVAQRIDSQLSAYVIAIQSAGVSARRVIRGGVPVDSILESVRASARDLIVMGTHGRRGISRVLKGSVVEAVLRRASCQVFAVRTPKFAPGYQRMMQMET